MKKYKLTLVLLIAFLSMSSSIVVSGAVSAQSPSPEEYCQEQVTVNNSDDAGELAACISAARAAESQCYATNGAGGEAVQCIENYYNGLRGQSGPNPNRLDNVAVDDELDVDCETSAGEELNSDNCAIVSYLVTAINLLSALAGIVIIFSIMFAGYQYMTARDNAGQIQQARTRIIWAIVAMLIFIFFYGALNFLVPGGLLL